MVTFIGSSLQEKCLGSLFHYTQHSWSGPRAFRLWYKIDNNTSHVKKKYVLTTYNFEDWRSIAISGPPLKISLFPLTREKGPSVGKYFFFSSKVNEFQNMRKSHSMTKPTKWSVRQAKTHIRLGIHLVWSVFNVRMTLATQWADSKDYDRRIPSLNWVFAGHTGHFVCFVMRQLIS